MIRIRLIVGAVLFALLSLSAALADQVEVITPGDGIAGFAPSTGTGSTTAQSRQSERDDSGPSPFDSGEVDVQPGLQTMHFGGVSLACQVAPSSRDLVVTNQSLEPLPPGTRIKWQLKNERTRGYFAIIGELGGGQSLVADNVLDGAAGKDDVCVARVI